jgi:hypothetical protein
VESLEDRVVLDATGLLADPHLDFAARVDQYLTTFENQVSVHPFQQKIPLIGDALARVTGASFVEEVRQKGPHRA